MEYFEEMKKQWELKASQLKESQEEIAALKREHKISIEDMKAKIAEKDAWLEKQSQALESLEQEKKQWESKASKSQEEIAALKREHKISIEDMKAKIAEKDAWLEKQSQALESLEQEKKQWESKASKSQEEIAALKREHKISIEDMKAKIAEKDAWLEKQSQALESLEQEKKQWESKASKSQEEIAALKREHKISIEDMKAKIAEKDAWLEKQSQALESLEQEKKQWESKASKSQEEIAALKREHKISIEDMKAKIAEKDAWLEKQSQALESLEQEKKQWESKASKSQDTQPHPTSGELMLGPTSAASPEPDPIQQPPKRRKTTHAIKQEQLADSGTAPLSDAQCISNAIKGVSVKHEELSVGVQVKVWQETTWRTGTVHSLHGAELYGVRWLGAGDEAVEDMQLKWEHHGIDNRSAHRWFVAMKQEANVIGPEDQMPYMAIRRQPTSKGDKREFQEFWNRYMTFGYNHGSPEGGKRRTVPIDRHPEVKNALNAMYTKYTQKKRSPQEKQELLRHMLCIFRQISYWETKGLFKKPPQQLPWCKPSVVIDGQELVDVDAEDDVQEVDCVVLQEEHGYLDVDAEADMLPPGPALKPKAEPSE